MATRGDVQKDTFFTIGGSANVVTGPEFAEPLEECCVDLLLFGDLLNPTDPFKNDKTSYFEYYSNDTDTAILKLQKCENGTFVDKATITDNTYGEFSDFGDFQADNRNYISIKNIDWTAILSAFDRGKYRFIVETTNILASVTPTPDCSFTYKLDHYSAKDADGTVFIKAENSNLLGNIKDQKQVFTFPPEWMDGIRIPAIFGFNFSEYEEEQVRYDDGFLQDLTNDQTAKFLLKTDRIPAILHDYIKTNVLQANIIKMTDYNTDNPNKHVDTMVKRTSSYEPVYYPRVKNSKVEVEFKSAFDNLRELLC